jgi:galactose mutarotase-like enzyme
MVTLANTHLRATLSPHGAELQSLVWLASGEEIMWSGDPVYWPRHSPVLFPLVGMLNNGRYRLGDGEYSLPRHGFAREQPFVCISQTSEEARFQLRWNEQTLLWYPFRFMLDIVYQLLEDTISVTYEVRLEEEQEPLFFSIGSHPAFVLPWREGGDLSSWYLLFPEDTMLRRHHLEDGLLNGGVSQVNLNGGKLPLNEAMFAEDAWVLHGCQSDRVLLGGEKSSVQLEMKFTGFPWFGIWKPAGAPFLCLEPWCGVTDQKGYIGDWKDRPGMERVGHADIWKRSWSVRFINTKPHYSDTLVYH